MAKKLAKLVEKDKNTRKMCEKMSAKCQDMEQKLKDTRHENKKLFVKFNALADRVIAQQSLMIRKFCTTQDFHLIVSYKQCFL